MPTIELDVRAIPQLYGSSYPSPQSHGFTSMPRQAGAPQLFGSCLSASFEMIVDWIKLGARKRAYSTFKLAGPWSATHSRKGNPNGDKFVNLMWNQATLHNTIYGSADCLLHLVGEHPNDGGLGGVSRTVSLEHSRPKVQIRETVEIIQNQNQYLDWIRTFLKEYGHPIIALTRGARFNSSSNEFPSWHQHNERPPLSELPKSRIEEAETVRNGHAVVIAGIYERNLGIINQPSMDQCDLLILDPAPSIELENHPERFYNPPNTLTDPCWHTHRVDARDFIRYIKSERGLITFHP